MLWGLNSARVTARSVQLPAFSPYSIALIGYGIDRGSLNLRTEQTLSVRDLLSQNKVVIEQLTLGPKVESPTAMNVPVQLGLAILKDRNGDVEPEHGGGRRVWAGPMAEARL